MLTRLLRVQDKPFHYSFRTQMSTASVLKCQEDSYLTKWRSNVVSCEPVKLDGITQYDVVLEDTIVFPEGGGQPSDTGKLDGAELVSCFRQDGVVKHRVPNTFEIGKEVEIEIDWKRRQDHMQQHSGQHLLSALATEHFNWDTVSWNLGVDKCSIDVASPKAVTALELIELEEIINNKIKLRLPVTVTQYDRDDPELKKVYSRGIPEDVTGKVRVIAIGDVDRNTCCGTHVTNTAEIICIKLLHFEKFKANYKIFFVCGDRVRNNLDYSYGLQRQLQTVLSAPPSNFIEKINDLQKLSQANTKKVKELWEEIGYLQGSLSFNSIKSGDSKSICHHKEDGTQDYLNAFLKGLSQTPKTAKKVGKLVFDYLVLLSVGDKNALGGILVLCGPEKDLNIIIPKITDITGAKGKLINGEFRAKLLTCQEKNISIAHEFVNTYQLS